MTATPNFLLLWVSIYGFRVARAGRAVLPTTHDSDRVWGSRGNHSNPRIIIGCSEIVSSHSVLLKLIISTRFK